MKFSIVIIARNEAKTLPRLYASIQEFLKRGGEVVLLDTGSNDGTASMARFYGFKVEEVGDKFLHIIDVGQANNINARFACDGKWIVVPGESYFDFAAARNYAASLASHDMVSFMDADEAFTRLDIDAIDSFITDGFTQFEYQFVFSHDQFGSPAVEFVQSKFYDRRKMEWIGIIHESLRGEGKIKFLDRNIFRLEHWQNHETNRSGYLRGLAVDCFNNPEKDRNSHYLAREMMWTGHPKSAIKEFLRHIAMNKWPAERAQSMSFIGDCFGMLNKPDDQVAWYGKAFMYDSSRREPLIKLARFYQANNNPMAANAYATAVREIGWADFYANNRAHYENEPHEILYWAKGWFGDIPGAKKHLLEALKWQPLNPQYLRDTKFYFEYADPQIEGWMTFPELTWLYEMAKRVLTVAEIGSFKGKSTHALCAGNPGMVTAIDTFKGSEDVRDKTHGALSIRDQFDHNLRGFKNLAIKQMSSHEASEHSDKYDMVFIDAGHTYDEVRQDILDWKDKAVLVLCGHDYSNVWPEVKKAVDDTLGPVFVHDTIWYKFMGPKVSFIIPTLGRPEGLKRCLDSIAKLIYPKELIEVIVLEDRPRIGVPLRVKEGVAKTTGDYICFASNDVEFAPDSLIRALREDKGLVAFNTGDPLPDGGAACEHFIIKRDLIPKIGGEIFCTRFYHVGTDNLLFAKAKKLGEAVRCEEAIVKHHHFSKGAPMDEIYELGWKNVEEDRAILAEELAKL